MDFIEFKNVSRHYQMGGNKIKAVDDVTFTIEKGKYTVIVGASGSGKSTTLNLLGAMDRATSGEVNVFGQSVTAMNDSQMEDYRREDIGFVFQFYNLIPSLTARENVAIAAKLSSNPLDVDQVIEAVGLGDRKYLFPSNLSGGELQRLSIARALVKNPKLLLCDEPTGALDSDTGRTVLKLLIETAKANNIALVIVTHNVVLAETADRVIRLKDGKAIENYVNDSPVSIMEVVW